MRGEYVAPSLGKVTVGELGPGWLERQRGHMKPSGFRSYESAWRVHVAPRWAATAHRGPPFHRRTSVGRRVGRQARTGDRATAYSVLARILDDAVRDRMLATNPARGVKLPKRPPRRNVYLTAEQLHLLADEAGRYGSLVLLLGVGGLRWGEAAALRVSRYRLPAAPHRAAPQRGDVIGRQTFVGTLKCNKNRTVVLPAFVIDALAQTAEGKGRDELLWPSADGRLSRAPPAASESWLSGAVARCQKADPTFPRVTAHALRHTAASLAISAGANVKVVQRMLGHANAAMTLDVYADLFESDLDAVAERLETALRDSLPRRDHERR